MALEAAGARCEQLAPQLLIYGRPMPMDEIIARIDAVDQAAVARVARRLRRRPARPSPPSARSTRSSPTTDRGR